MNNKTPGTGYFAERKYRGSVDGTGLSCFSVQVKETDLWISADIDLSKETRDLVFECRFQIESFIIDHPDFESTLYPFTKNDYSPPLVDEMISAGRQFGVGPMASVAGAVAQYVGNGLLTYSDQIIVENGGDIFISSKRPVTVSILAGDSPLSGRFGLRFKGSQTPVGVCSSSGVVGHSLSMGSAHVACVVSTSATVADAAATSLCNRIREQTDMKKAIKWAQGMTSIIGGVIILDDTMGTWGDISLVQI